MTKYMTEEQARKEADEMRREKYRMLRQATRKIKDWKVFFEGVDDITHYDIIPLRVKLKSGEKGTYMLVGRKGIDIEKFKRTKHDENILIIVFISDDNSIVKVDNHTALRIEVLHYSKRIEIFDFNAIALQQEGKCKPIDVYEE